MTAGPKAKKYHRLDANDSRTNGNHPNLCSSDQVQIQEIIFGDDLLFHYNEQASIAQLDFCHERQRSHSSAELAEKMSPYYLWCVEKFGLNRRLFESNFPVDKASYSCTVLLNVFKLIAKGF